MVESPPVRLSDLFAGVEGWRLAGAADVDISSLCYRSDQAGPGSLFFCVPGFVRDGHDFAPDAVARGASALCVERPLDLPVAQVVVPSVRQAMGPVAAAFYGHPSSRLLTVGITGTNGKTTSAFLAAHLLDQAGLRAGLMGTVERRIGGRSLPAGRTTPEALDIQRDLAEMVAAGDKAAVMEVSSHALDLGRARGIDFRAVAFTNLTQDHLDYHKTLEDYFAAKSRLFLDPEFAGRAAGGGDQRRRSVRAGRWRRSAPARDVHQLLDLGRVGWSGRGGPGVERLRHRCRRHAGHPGACGERRWRREAWRGGTTGAAEARFDVATRLVGAFNVANTLTALGIGLGLGLDLRADAGGASRLPGRPRAHGAGGRGSGLRRAGRLRPHPRLGAQRAADGAGHHPGEAHRRAGLRGRPRQGQASLMGREAESAADLVVITSDNPRSEDPAGHHRRHRGGARAPGRGQGGARPAGGPSTWRSPRRGRAMWS